MNDKSKSSNDERMWAAVKLNSKRLRNKWPRPRKTHHPGIRLMWRKTTESHAQTYSRHRDYRGVWSTKHFTSSLRGKAFPVHVMEAYRGSRGTAPHILNFGTIWLTSEPGRFNPGKGSPAPTGRPVFLLPVLIYMYTNSEVLYHSFALKAVST